ncbi:MAG: FHA domain-containing protein [Deltaproteobacteria bacterium]|nr:FHA domain-containing protein [Deltaproteobacteria bacterium]
MTVVAGTKTDVGAREWVIDDAVTRLRLWGTQTIFTLPGHDTSTVGSGEACEVRLDDSSGRVSRQHGRLVRDQERWILRDLHAVATALREPGVRVQLAVCTQVDRAWVAEHAASSLPEIEKATLRIIALRQTGTLAGAATLLGMSTPALSDWLKHRRLP